MKLKSLRKKFERFCFQNRNKGIPNLMLYVSVGSAIVYLMTVMTQNTVLYNALSSQYPAAVGQPVVLLLFGKSHGKPVGYV